MLRVVQLDSDALDSELYEIIWSSIKGFFSVTQYKEECKLLSDTLIFYFASKYMAVEGATSTYGSRLSDMSFKCGRGTLYAIMIMQQYLNKKLSRYLYDSTSLNERRRTQLLKFYRIVSVVYRQFDFINFCYFIGSFNNSNFPTLWSRLLNIESVANKNDLKTSFYEMTVYSGIEYQNRQLLWNALLELFTAVITPRTMAILLSSTSESYKQNETKTTVVKFPTCYLCKEFPTNPYKMSCCGSLYCYVCAIKSLEWRKCRKCGKTSELKANKIYT